MRTGNTEAEQQGKNGWGWREKVPKHVRSVVWYATGDQTGVWSWGLFTGCVAGLMLCPEDSVEPLRLDTGVAWPGFHSPT